MIRRMWRGWTTPENADAYEELLRTTVLPDIAARRIAGYRGIELWRREDGDEVAFVTVMRFDSLEAVKAFVGDDYERAHVPEEARRLLRRFDERSRHYELREALGEDGGSSAKR